MPARPNRLLALLVLLVGLESHALTLGRVQGAALVGRGLNVNVQVQLDPDQTAANACFEADVFHADARQDPARVKVTVEPTQVPQTVNVRVISENPIDEPIVTVYMRAGCAQKISRRYVLLADIVSEQAVPYVPRPVTVPLVVPATAPVEPRPAVAAAPAPAAVAATSSAATATAPARTEPAAPARVRPPRPAKPAAAPKPPPAPARKEATAKAAPAKPAPRPAAKQQDEKAQAGRTAGQSRLQLDPLELLSERVATLESTTASIPAAARDAQRLETLESSIKTLVALAAKNEASLLDLRTRMEKAESDRYSNPVIYLLAALLLACLVAIGYLLVRLGERRGAADANWWDGSVEPEPARRTTHATERTSGFAPMSSPSPLSQPDQLPDSDRMALQPTQQITREAGLRAPAAAATTQVDVSLVEMSESTFDRLMQSGAAHNAIRKSSHFEPSAPVAIEPVLPEAAAVKSRRINAEELFDVRQQAEFFVSLGQTDQAVQILEARIAKDGESSPQAYLDLLKLFHSLGLRADFRQVREDFTLLFNAAVPDFAEFDDEGRPLEDYPAVVDKLSGVWGTAAVLDTIEGLLFRSQWNTDEELFDLAAFRDLLLLHAVAQANLAEAVYMPDTVSVPLPAIDGLAELDIDLTESAAPDSGAAATSQLAPSEAPAAGNLIDFDLTDLLVGKDSKPGQ